MVSVSSGWLEAQKQRLLPEMFIEITSAITEPGLQGAATASANTETEYAETAGITVMTTGVSDKYSTLEHGLWGLDGSFSYRAVEPKNPGYVSGVLSGENGTFDNPPTIKLTVPLLRINLIPGITITWSDVYDEWPTRFWVGVYRDDELQTQTTVTDNNAPQSVVWLDMERYNKVVIKIYDWSLPYHRARCMSVFLGIRTVYEKSDLMGFTHTQTVDLLSAALPKNEITFSLRNEDNRWNPDNPTGGEQYLQERQEVRLRYGMAVNDEIEWIDGGTFWLSGWETPTNGLEATFTARDALEFMNEEYTGARSGTLYDIAIAALTAADLPEADDGSVRYHVDDSLKTITTDFSSDTGTYTMRDILQMVAHAGNCVFWQDRSGVLRIEPWKSNGYNYQIDQSVSYAHPEYTLSKPLKAIAVRYGDDQQATVTVADRGEVQTVENVMLGTRNDALRVANRAKEVLENRKIISGDFRADVRLDALDLILVTSKYARNLIAVTEIEYTTTGGAIRGRYSGRVIPIEISSTAIRSGDVYAGEV